MSDENSLPYVILPIYEVPSYVHIKGGILSYYTLYIIHFDIHTGRVRSPCKSGSYARTSDSASRIG